MPDRPERRLSRTRDRMPLVLVALLLLAVPTGVASAKSRKSHSSRPKVSGFAFSPATFNPGAMKDTKRAKRSTTITFTPIDAGDPSEEQSVTLPDLPDGAGLLWVMAL